MYIYIYMYMYIYICIHAIEPHPQKLTIPLVVKDRPTAIMFTSCTTLDPESQVKFLPILECVPLLSFLPGRPRPAQLDLTLPFWGLKQLNRPPKKHDIEHLHCMVPMMWKSPTKWRFLRGCFILDPYKNLMKTRNHLQPIWNPMKNPCWWMLMVQSSGHLREIPIGNSPSSHHLRLPPTQPTILNLDLYLTYLVSL